MSGNSPASPPRAARRFVAWTVAAGALAAIPIVVLAFREPFPLLEGLGLALIATGAFFLHRRSFVVHWRAQRIASTLDEPIALVGFLVLAPAHAVLAVLVGISLAQVAARRAPIKMTFNVGSYTLATVAAFLAFTGVVATGAHVLLAVLAAALAYALTSNVLISHLFARIESASATRVFQERFAMSTVASTVLGAGFVASAWALWLVSPIAVVALVPIVALAIGHADALARLDREASVRARLAEATRALLASPDEGALGMRILQPCGELFLAGRAEIVLGRALEDPRVWSVEFEGGADPGRAPLEAPLMGRDDESIGTLRIFPARRTMSAKDTRHDAALLNLFAAEAAAALELARVVRRYASLHSMHDRVVRHAPAGIVQLDERGVVEEVNEAFERAMGDPRGAWNTLLGFPAFADGLRSLARGVPFRDVEVRVDGLVFDVAGVPLPPAEGELRSPSIVLFRDVSAHHEAAEAQRKHSVTRPLVRRIVLEIVREGAVPERLLVALGHQLANETDARTPEEFAGAFRDMGLGDLHADTSASGMTKFVADDLIERRPHAKQPTCHVARGFVEGVIERLEGHPALGSEIQCQSQGHAKCTFLVKAKPALAKPTERARAR